MPERRRPGRNEPLELARPNGSPEHIADERSLVLPRSAGRFAMVLVAAYAIAGIAAGGPPSLPVCAAMLASIVLPLLAGLLASIAGSGDAPQALRTARVCAGIAAPMAVAGYALASWAGEGLSWQWAAATLVSINAAAFLCDLRPRALLFGQIASWAGFAMLDANPMTATALAGLALALALIARIEWAAANRRRAARDARERVAARAEDILRSFEETGQGWFWETDRRGHITYISPKAALVLGRSQEEICGNPLSTIVDPAVGQGAARALSFHLAARSPFQDVELRAAGPGEERWWALTGRPVYDETANFCGFRGHGTDLTEKRRSEQQVSRLAHYDWLTGLANRVQMGQALEQILAAPSARERACAVLMIDLDRFKQVNDTLGHPAGDALLKQVAQRLERAINGAGRCGRLGGDEFQVIVPGEQDRALLGDLAAGIIAAISQPYAIEGQSVVIGASVGIALSPEDGVTSDALVRNVDLALYAAKDAGRGVYRFYAEDLHAAAEERAELEQDLRAAIARGEFEMHYQPVVYAATERIVGFEALMRWNHPRRGWLSPSRFVPIAEDAGLIDGLGQWALRTACADLARWPDPIRCAVNVSALQFANPELPGIIASALAHAGVDPARLELEITESVFLSDNAGTEAMFKALKGVGVRLALDDFGTGYSSLGYLRQAPFDKIKIDRTFVRGASEEGSRNGAIIAAITSLTEALHMDTTAEGVETADELELVRLLGCSHVQGHIYYPPMSLADATALACGDLHAQTGGSRCARALRHDLLRRVEVCHADQRSNATLRNINESGAMIEGLWNMPVGTRLRILFESGIAATGQVRWSHENRLGLAFDTPLERAADGALAALAPLPCQSAEAAEGRDDECLPQAERPGTLGQK